MFIDNHRAIITKSNIKRNTNEEKSIRILSFLNHRINITDSNTDFPFNLFDTHSVLAQKLHHTLAIPSLRLAASLTPSVSLRTYPFSNIRVMYYLLYRNAMMTCQIPNVTTVIARCRSATSNSPRKIGTNQPKNKKVQLNPKYPDFMSPDCG